MLLLSLNLTEAGEEPPEPPAPTPAPAVVETGGSYGSPRKRKKKTLETVQLVPQPSGRLLLPEPGPKPAAKPVQAKAIEPAPRAEVALMKNMDKWTADSEKLAAQIKLMEEEEEEALAVLLAFL